MFWKCPRWVVLLVLIYLSCSVSLNIDEMLLLYQNWYRRRKTTQVCVHVVINWLYAWMGVCSGQVEPFKQQKWLFIKLNVTKCFRYLLHATVREVFLKRCLPALSHVHLLRWAQRSKHTELCADWSIRCLATKHGSIRLVVGFAAFKCSLWYFIFF